MNDEELWAQEAHDERKRIREERDYYRDKYLDLHMSSGRLRGLLGECLTALENARPYHCPPGQWDYDQLIDRVRRTA